MNIYDLKERIAVVTGGAQGIGYAVAQRILASGGRVSIWDRDTAVLGKTAASLGGPERVQGLSVDIANAFEAMTGMIETAGPPGSQDLTERTVSYAPAEIIR